MAVAGKVLEQIEGKKNLTSRVMSALKAGGTQALAQLLNHPAASFVIAGLEDLHKTR